MLFAQTEQVFQRIRTKKLRLATFVFRRGGGRLRLFQAPPEFVLRRIFRRFPGFQRGLPDRTIPRATAEISAKLIVQLPIAIEILAVIPLEHRHDDPRRAVAALGAVIGHHALLDRVQLSVAEPLDGDNFPPLHQREGRQTTIERPPDRTALRIGLDHRHRTRPAVALRAPLFRPGAPRRPHPVQKRCVRRHIHQTDRLAVEGKLQGLVHGAGN